MSKPLDLIGRKFYKLLVISRSENNNGRTMWLCRCDCGNEKTIPGTKLNNGYVKSCGCLREMKDLTGMRFFNILVLGIYEKTHKYGKQRIYWRCLCDCGKEHVESGENLKSGSVKSCGCLKNARRKAQRATLIHLKYNDFIHSANSGKRRKRKISVSITEEEYTEIILKPCFYCGNLGSNKFRAKGYDEVLIHNGVDRVDSSKDYSIDNVVPCCKICNNAKASMSLENFIEWIKNLYIRSVINRMEE